MSDRIVTVTDSEGKTYELAVPLGAIIINGDAPKLEMFTSPNMQQPLTAFVDPDCVPHNVAGGTTIQMDGYEWDSIAQVYKQKDL